METVDARTMAGSKRPQLKAQGETRPNRANIFGFICGRNGSVSQPRETGDVVEVRRHQKEKNRRGGLQNKSARRQRKRRRTFQLLLGRTKRTHRFYETKINYTEEIIKLCRCAGTEMQHLTLLGAALTVLHHI